MEYSFFSLSFQSTCHTLRPTFEQNSGTKYDAIYCVAEVIIQLGKFARLLFAFCKPHSAEVAKEHSNFCQLYQKAGPRD